MLKTFTPPSLAFAPAVMSSGSDPAMWWGVPWSDALAGIFTALAFAAAAFVAVQEFRKNRLDRERQTALEESAQASRVFAWLTVTPRWDGPMNDELVDSRYEIRLHNTSDQPVFDAVVTYEWASSDRPTAFRREALMPSTSPIELVMQEEMGEKPASSSMLPLTFRDARTSGGSGDVTDHFTSSTRAGL